MSSWNCSSVLYETPPVGQGGMVSGLRETPSSSVGPGIGDEGAVGHFHTEHRETNLSPVPRSLPVWLKNME